MDSEMSNSDDSEKEEDTDNDRVAATIGRG